MNNYKIKMSLELINESDPTDKIDVMCLKDMSEEQAESIDMVERIFIDLNRDVLKKSISEHLENISKKNA